MHTSKERRKRATRAIALCLLIAGDLFAQASPTITVTASNQDGNNPITARLGRNVAFYAKVQGENSTAVTWSLQGPGSISSAGVYTAPPSMPAQTSITITAALTADPTLSASYQMTLGNPIPIVYSTSPKYASLNATNAVSINGMGFVTGSVVFVNGQPVSSVYQSPTTLLAQIPVAVKATGSLAITVQNPVPSGGVSAVFPMPLATPSLTLTASNQDGANPTVARLGRNVAFYASVQGEGNTAVTWSLQGPGSVSSSGVYTAPSVMPADTSLSISAALIADPSVSATYQMTLGNPVPLIYSINPKSGLTSTVNAVTINGLGFVAGSVVVVDGLNVTATYVSPTVLLAQVTLLPGQSQPVTLTINNPDPAAATSLPFSIGTSVPNISAVSPSTLPVGAYTLAITGSNLATTSRVFLNGKPISATYVSPTQLTITGQVLPFRTQPLSIGIGDAQATSPFSNLSVPVTNAGSSQFDMAARFSMQAAFGPRPDVVTHIQQVGLTTFLSEQFAQPVSTYTSTPFTDYALTEFLNHALTDNNLLRQRVAWALENFIAVSVPNDGATYQAGVPWQLMMERDAFGNFRDLLTDVTMNSTMGVWLNLGNNWASTNSLTHPNQNYARELMQLFSIGTDTLNDDGSAVLDSFGNPVPAYAETTVLELSRALTGWGLPAATSSNFSAIGIDFSLPLQPYENRHDHGQKTLFGAVVLPAGQTITQDRDAALDAIFNQPSVPPFVSKLLIQSLVKSDPSPAYVQRISAVFKDDGNGVRGDLQAVVQAILLDSEARCADSPSCTDNLTLNGHMRDPVLYFLSVLSGLQIAPNNGALKSIAEDLGEHIWEPPSVFGFYSPSYQIPGTTIKAPEFQLFNGNYAVQRSQVLFNILSGKELGFDGGYRSSDWLFTGVESISDILDAINHMYYHGAMSPTVQDAITAYCQSLSDRDQQQIAALYLALNSDSFQIAQ